MTVDTIEYADLADIPDALPTPVTSRTGGKPSLYTKELAINICQLLKEGVPLRAICRLEGFPSWPTVYAWMYKDDALSKAIARSRDIGTDAIAEDGLIALAEKPERGPDNRVDGGWVQWRKMQSEQTLKLLAKWNPKRYGEKLDLGNAGGQPFQITIAK
jgi:hypothetical protein